MENLREPLDRAGSREKDGRLFLYAAPDLWSVDVSVAGLTAMQRESAFFLPRSVGVVRHPTTSTGAAAAVLC